MALTFKKKHYYGDSAQDIEPEIARFSKMLYPASAYRAATCPCGGNLFLLESDEEVGVGRRTCVACHAAHYMGDGEEYAESATLEGHVCLCDADRFELRVGVALYEDSRDVRWFYIGCRCVACGLTGVFAHWKCEGGDADALLARV